MKRIKGSLADRMQSEAEVGFRIISKEDAAKIIAKRDHISYDEALKYLNSEVGNRDDSELEK